MRSSRGWWQPNKLRIAGFVCALAVVAGLGLLGALASVRSAPARAAAVSTSWSLVKADCTAIGEAVGATLVQVGRGCWDQASGYTATDGTATLTDTGHSPPTYNAQYNWSVPGTISGSGEAVSLGVTSNDVSNNSGLDARICVGQVPESFPLKDPGHACAEAVAPAANQSNSASASVTVMPFEASPGTDATLQISFGGNVYYSYRASSTAGTPGKLTVTYTVPDRIYVSSDDHMLHYPTTPGAISPSKWPVDLTVQNCDAQASYRWQVKGKNTAATYTAPCSFEVQFPHLGRYSVEVRATPAGGGTPSVGKLDVRVKDYLIVGVGDSMASGESTPDRPLKTVAGDPGPGDPPDNVTPSSSKEPVWQDRQCDRSGYSYQAQVALALERGDPQTSVTFVPLGCSGASILQLVNKWYSGINAGPRDLAPQIKVLRKLIGRRTPDSVILSAGINDLYFGQIAAFCWIWPTCPTKRWKGILFGAKQGNTLTHLLPGWLKLLPARYAALAGALRGLGVPPSRVYIGQYPDPLHDGSSLCDTSSHLGLLGISKVDAEWLFYKLLVPLNGQVFRAAKTAHWTFVPGAQQEFKTHGYCAPDSWITTYPQSATRQGDNNGTFHPNYTGHKMLAQLFIGRLKSALGVP